jgi:hypothetical protein
MLVNKSAETFLENLSHAFRLEKSAKLSSPPERDNVPG